MSQEREKALAIQLDDGRVVVATPKPEDQDRLAKLDKDIVLLTASGDFDTAGHGYGDLIELDVEGHAITLRLPSPADAEQVRRALAVGAVTATIVAAGAIAALQGSQPAAPALQPVAAPAPIVQVQPAGAETRQQNRIQAQDKADRDVSDNAPVVHDGKSPGTHGPGRGELEFDQ